MLALNAAKLYGFDLEQLGPLAARFGPTKAEIAAPIALSDIPNAAQKCPGFVPDNQLPAA